jgi:hypothetical protein
MNLTDRTRGCRDSIQATLGIVVIKKALHDFPDY